MKDQEKNRGEKMSKLVEEKPVEKLFNFTVKGIKVKAKDEQEAKEKYDKIVHRKS